jgi:hypothetical protein
MAKRHLPDQSVLLKLLRYEPETGHLYWRERPREFFKTDLSYINWNRMNAGNRAFGYVDGYGYCQGSLFGKHQSAHAVVWCMVHGEPPANHIDHVNSVRSDNRIENLRDVTALQNGRNAKMSKRNRSGVVGVFFDKATRQWQSQISLFGHTRFLGRFDDMADAVRARVGAEMANDFHPNHGRK